MSGSWFKWALLVATLLGAASPTGRLGKLTYTLALGIPVLLFAIWGRTTRDFMLWAYYILSFTVFLLLRKVADATGLPWQADYVITIDRVLGLGHVPTLWLQQQLYHFGSASWLDWFAIGVHLSYYVAPMVAGVLLWKFAPRTFEPYMTALSLSYLVGVAVHFALPTVPPWMAGLTGELPRVYRVINDVYYRVSPAFYDYGYRVAGGNDVAAMPSLHTAIAALIACALWQVGGAWRALGVFYTVAMGFSLTYLGEHYVADVLGGVLLAVGCYAWALRYYAAAARKQAAVETPAEVPGEAVPAMAQGAS